MEWDHINKRFVKEWSISKQNSCIIGIDDNNLEEYCFFGIQWKPIVMASSSSWSADTVYTGDTILGNIAVFFPFVEVYGQDASIIRDLVIPFVQQL